MANCRMLWVCLALVLMGCRDTPTLAETQVLPGRFHATITGAVSAEIQGAALLEPMFGARVVFLRTEDHSRTLLFSAPIFGDGSFDFRTGTHSVGSILGGTGMDVTLNTLGTEGDFFLATSGKVRIIESTAQRVVAAFDFQARSGPPGAGKQVRVRGAFHAIREQWPGV